MGVHGLDKVVEVPLGITITDDLGVELASLNVADKHWLLLKGTAGGNPANDYKPERGSSRMIRLLLKLIADGGFVGFPNAGKSSLLCAVSRASPKVSAFPFTTVKPELGTIVYDDDRRITLADLPGLIEGASYNVGMGHKFLKHVERTKVLVFVVDVDGFCLQPGSPPRTAFETVTLLSYELEQYQPAMLDKPAMLLVNKMDLESSRERLAELETYLAEGVLAAGLEHRPSRLPAFLKVLPISAKTGDGVDVFVRELRVALDRLAETGVEMFETAPSVDMKVQAQMLKVDSARE